MSLPLFLIVLCKRLPLAVAVLAAVFAGAGAVLVLTPPRYEATAVASIDPSSADPVSGLGPTPGSLLIVQGNLTALARSEQVALDVVRRLSLDKDADLRARYAASGVSGRIDIRHFAASQALDRLEARFAPGSNVLNLTFRAASPQKAADVANAFMAAFIDAAIAMKGQAAQKAADWFAPQIEKIGEKLAQARQGLATFQKDASLLAPGANDSEADRLLSAANALSAAKADLMALQGQLATPGAGASDAQDPDVQSLIALRAVLSAAEAEIARLSAESGANHPKVLEKQAARNSLAAQIEQQTDAFRLKLADRVASAVVKAARLEKAYAENLKDMIGVQAQRDRLAELKADMQFHQDEFERLQRAASQARLQSQLSFSNIAVIDLAAPPAAPTLPKPTLTLAFAGVVGTGLSVLAALTAEALDRRIRTGDDLAEAANAPLLGLAFYARPPRRLWGRFSRRDS